MDIKKITMAGFILTCIAQLFVPAKMIIDQDAILKTGMEYRFRTQPVDPNDPFRGKYITLSFTDNTFPITDREGWDGQEAVFVELTADAEGFAKIKNVSKTEPDNPDYMRTTIQYINSRENGQDELVINFPFDRYYMEESKAQPAEEIYQESNLDSAQVTYALVYVKDGGSVLKDVVIDGKSIKDMVEEMEE